MKKPSTPQVLYSSQAKLKSDRQLAGKSHHKTPSAVSYIIAAAKKVTGVFRVFLPRKTKATSNGAVTDDASKSNIQVKRPYSTDQSTESYTKNSTGFKSSDSYVSSGSISGQVATVNFSFEEIYKATEKFSAANKIGEGRFGTVYKGKLKDGFIVAVKRAKKNKYDKYMLLEFKNEILTLSKIEHLNLVKLFGYLDQADEKIILVEYVGNGNLREHLDGKRGNGLETAERLDIAIDVAHALTYLHTYSGRYIISIEPGPD
ncbi:hypothetical protein Pint_32602 [Pistacia integerrima]|uniref:Uncharacterized protein n=1 Tax=Pistacia integerrima TaxID=434235 RepID=A0ACC0XQV4_9ROSI|nr:hypothetical protein Pint_32602 [Pistacia integerrima]